MKPEEVFPLMVENAFGFLQKALKEFAEEPKYSAINFHAAVELILKARLLREHWTLIDSKPETANLKKFLAGDFRSVGIKEAAHRLESIIQDGLTAAELKSFEQLTGHRNRLVHFFHEKQTGGKVELEKIVSEHCRAWYYLNKLLLGRWKDIFREYRGKIQQADISMRRHRHYLNAKFQDLQQEIQKLTSKGIALHNCPACGFKASKKDDSDMPLVEFECIVCEFKQYGVVINCPECSHEKLLIGEPWGQDCDHCNHKFKSEDIQKAFKKSLTKDTLDDCAAAHCSECGGFKTVVEVGGKWICSTCFTPYNFSEIKQCEWCNEYSTGDLEMSYLRGCVICDGKTGWDMDKDN